MNDPDATKSATDPLGPDERPGQGKDQEDGERIDPRELQQEIEERYEELEGRYDEIKGMLEAYNEQARSTIREHPVASVAGALGAGYIVGRLAARRWLV
jgi:ElaB/YqjD/DUF883 family membrane-anchored ribosome-binding protein